MPAMASSLYHEVSAKAVNQQQQQIIKYGSFSVLAIQKPIYWPLGAGHT